MRAILSIVTVLAALACYRTQAPEVASTPITPTGTPVATPSPRNNESFSPDKAGTRPWAFEEIDEAVSASSLTHLRGSRLDSNDIEVRVWGGFGLTKLQGTILKRINGKWSATTVTPEFRKPDTWKYNLIPLSEPRQTWEKAWQDLLALGILTLPDAESIDCSAMMNDGYSFVFEIRKGRDYRTYSYDNPSSQFDNRCEQADRVLAIAKILSTDYERRSSN